MITRTCSRKHWEIYGHLFALKPKEKPSYLYKVFEFLSRPRWLHLFADSLIGVIETQVFCQATTPRLFVIGGKFALSSIGGTPSSFERYMPFVSYQFSLEPSIPPASDPLIFSSFIDDPKSCTKADIKRMRDSLQHLHFHVSPTDSEQHTTAYDKWWQMRIKELVPHPGKSIFYSFSFVILTSSKY